MTVRTEAISVDLQVKNVLVPLDGSELALQAMPTARVLADRLGAVLSTISVASADAEVPRLRALAAAVLGVDVDHDRVRVVRGDDPAEVIAARAEKLDHCVPCGATHGRGRLGGAVMGSVARSVLQRWREPMIVLGPMADNPGWTPRPRSWPEPLSVPRIVACVDGSDSSEEVLPVAAAWARALDMTLSVLTVVYDAPQPLRTDLRQSQFDADSYINVLVERLQSSVPHVDGVVARDPIDPAGGIWRHLNDQPAGLLALATDARSGMQRVRRGAQAANIVRAATVPCLVAHVRDQ